MRDVVREPIVLDEHVVDVDVSIGIAQYPVDGTDADSLFRNADSAMFEAKRQRLGYMRYLSTLEHAPSNDLRIARELREGLPRHELEMVYQPEVDLRSGELVRVEALLRWRHPRRGLLLPDEFIPAAERTRVMAQVSRWVLRGAIQQLRRWSEAGWGLKVAVNLSAWDLHDTALAAYIEGLLREWQVASDRLTIEVTETVLMSDARRAGHTLEALRALGIRQSLDDFGTGYSSLSLITDLPTQEIKIDQSFVRKLPQDMTTRAVVRTLIQLAHELGRTIVGEGIDSPETQRLLTDLGCDIGQGYLLGQPMSPNELEHWKGQRHVWRGVAV
jgi:EAL domain-containing protein (putative c-di-GMP-specific phosphodiesterase class I)